MDEQQNIIIYRTADGRAYIPKKDKCPYEKLFHYFLSY